MDSSCERLEADFLDGYDRTKEIVCWTRFHIATSNLECHQCGHIIPAYTQYVRRVCREEWYDPKRRRRHKSLPVWREHAGNCPDTYGGGAHGRY